MTQPSTSFEAWLTEIRASRQHLWGSSTKSRLYFVPYPAGTAGDNPFALSENGGELFSEFELRTIHFERWYWSQQDFDTKELDESDQDSNSDTLVGGDQDLGM